MNTTEIKKKYTCFDLLGDGGKKVAGGYLYRCPWRQDKTPSLSVTNDGRGWRDFGSDEHGSVIDLAMKLWNLRGVSEVCARFGESVSFYQQNNFPKVSERKVVKRAFFTIDLFPLQTPSLLQYISSRSIDIQLAKEFCQEAHYTISNGKSFYSIAFANEQGGYELRNALWKGGTSPKSISILRKDNDTPWVVFEGFMDMLSFATLCGKMKHNYLVLNSIAFVGRAIEVLEDFDIQIFIALDNDKAGDEATKKILTALPSANDIRNRFSYVNGIKCKDVNEYLMALRKYHLRI